MYQPSQQAIKPIYKPQAHIKIGMIPIQKTSSKKKKTKQNGRCNKLHSSKTQWRTL